MSASTDKIEDLDAWARFILRVVLALTGITILLWRLSSGELSREWLAATVVCVSPFVSAYVAEILRAWKGTEKT